MNGADEHRAVTGCYRCAADSFTVCSHDLVRTSADLRGLIHAITNVVRGTGTSDRIALMAVGQRHRAGAYASCD